MLLNAVVDVFIAEVYCTASAYPNATNAPRQSVDLQKQVATRPTVPGPKIAHLGPARTLVRYLNSISVRIKSTSAPLHPRAPTLRSIPRSSRFRLQRKLTHSAEQSAEAAAHFTGLPSASAIYSSRTPRAEDRPRILAQLGLIPLWQRGMRSTAFMRWSCWEICRGSRRQRRRMLMSLGRKGPEMATGRHEVRGKGYPGRSWTASWYQGCRGVLEG